MSQEHVKCDTDLGGAAMAPSKRGQGSSFDGRAGGHMASCGLDRPRPGILAKASLPRDLSSFFACADNIFDNDSFLASAMPVIIGVAKDSTICYCKLLSISGTNILYVRDSRLIDATK